MFGYCGFVFLFMMVMCFLVCYYLYWGWGYKSCGVGDNRVWLSSFECGFVGQGFNLNSFSYTFLNLLVVFVIFDLEISLLLNIPFQGLCFDNHYYYLVFMIVVGFGYIIEVESGYINWSF